MNRKYLSKTVMQKSKLPLFRNGGIIKKFEKWCYKSKFRKFASNYKYLANDFCCLWKWNMAHDALTRLAI